MTAGTLVGGAAGGLSGARGAEFAKGLAAREGRLGGVARYGQRQVHGLTGWVPEGFAKTQEGRVAAIRSLRDPDYTRLEKNISDKVGLRKPSKGLVEDLRRHIAVGEMQKNDLTNLPGLARGLAHAPGETVKTMWHAATPMDKALAVGVPTLGIASAAMSKPQEGQPGRAERIGSSLSGLSGLGQSSMPTAAMMALGQGLGTAGKYTGRGIGRLMGRRQGLPKANTSPGMEPQPGDVSSGPVEYVYSNSALGRPPENLGGGV